MINNLAILKQSVLIYAVIFGLAGLLTLAFRKAGWGRNMKVAILMWAVIACLFVFPAYAGPVPFAVVILLLAYGAVREYLVLNRLYSPFRLVLAAIFLLAMAGAALTGAMRFFYALPLLSVFVFFPAHALTRSYEEINRAVALQVTGLVYWGWLLLHFLLLQRLEGGFGVIILLITMIALNDNAAFYVGKLLGRNSPKFAPRISPNKTWVGFAGGFTATVLIALAFGYAVPHLTLLQRLILGGVVGCAVPFGGLMESAMKRDLGVKDSGFLVPGHGGVMDRFDSWAFNAPIVYYLLRLLAACSG